jgi:glycosyltransferase involved in cell wall biosynthesis
MDPKDLTVAQQPGGHPGQLRARPRRANELAAGRGEGLDTRQASPAATGMPGYSSSLPTAVVTQRSTGRRFRVSIVIEWYNIARAKRDRATQMLATVASQAADLYCAADGAEVGISEPLDLVITYDSNKLQIRQVEQVVGEAASSSESLSLRFISVPSGTYCGQKNAGAAVARGDIIIFLDSDMIPEPGWLAGFLRAFTHADVGVGVGNTYVDHHTGGLYSRSLALTWMFPLRDTAGRLTKTEWFYANNVAFRRDTFLSRQFEDVPGLMHAAEGILVARLKHDGIPLWLVGEARAHHPPPNGVVHFIKRAVAGGRARALSSAPLGLPSVLEWIRHDLTSIYHGWKVSLLDGDTVGLRRWQVLGAVAIAATYYGLRCVGSLLCLLCPRFMRRRCDL